MFLKMALRAFRSKDFRGWIHPELELPDRLLDIPLDSSEIPALETLLECHGRRIFRLPVSIGGVTESCFVYVFQNRSRNRALRRCYAFRVLRVSHWLRKKGFGSLQVVVALKDRRNWLNWNSLLLAREISEVCELPSVGQHVFQVHQTTSLDRQMADALACELARFHDEGFVHGDLKSRHILVSQQAHPAPKFCLVDLEKAHYLPWLPSPFADILAGRDLVQLVSSLPATSSSRGEYDLLRHLLCSYLSQRKIGTVRRHRINRILGWYGPGGRLRQGETLLKGLLGGSKMRAKAGSSTKVSTS